MKRWRIYAASVGRPGQHFYSPRRDFQVIEAPSKMRALDKVAELTGSTHPTGSHKVAVPGIGFLHVEQVGTTRRQQLAARRQA